MLSQREWQFAKSENFMFTVPVQEELPVDRATHYHANLLHSLTNLLTNVPHRWRGRVSCYLLTNSLD
eukprot:scaffold61952_cov57-Phaeocystis_antarctica.AAC.1